MLDPVSIMGFARAVSSLSSMADHLRSSKGASAREVIELCDRVKAILDDASAQIASDTLKGLEGRAEGLKLWATLGVSGLGDSISAETKDGLTKSLTSIADRLDSVELAKASPEERRAMVIQLERVSGRMGGLADVLRFQQGGEAKNAMAKTTSWAMGNTARLGGWATGVIVSAGATLATSALATGASKVPFVGSTLASWIQGEFPTDPGGADDSESA